MKQFILGFLGALILIAIIYFGYPLIDSLRGGSGSVKVVPPNELKHDYTDIGTLKVKIFVNSIPIGGVEVDLGTIGSNGPIGLMSAIKTNQQGLALFEPVPAGTYDIFWNDNNFPQEYNQPPVMSVEIFRDKVTEKIIELTPKY
jgi:hypothetical protein